MKLVNFAIAMAHRGFPLTVAALEKHALEIVQIRNPSLRTFSKNWIQRFLIKYGSRVSTKWSVTLDSVHAKSVNASTSEHYFKLLEKTLKEHDIKPHNIYGFDESGFPLGYANKTQVVGPAGKQPAKTQRGGSKENVTAMCTICTGGSSIPPVIIFKGQYLLDKWLQINPVKAA